jgi:hypothetical protein
VLGFPCACREIVRQALAWLLAACGRTASPSDSAYCQARGRLSLTWLQEIQGLIAAKLQAACRPEHHWFGRQVFLVDGATASMPDTPANQAVFPQIRRQKPGCGFPLVRLVAAFSLATGAMLELAWDAFRVAERTLFHRLWERFPPGAVVVADRGFCGLADFWLLAQRGVDCVMRRTGRRSVGVLLVRQINPHDRWVLWRKARQPVRWLDRAAWDAIPAALLVREIRVVVEIPGFRTNILTIATTLLDEQKYPTAAFADLYRRRWLAELFLRDIKITTGMDALTCKSPAMVEKEITMHVIVYNLLRALMFQAAVEHDVDPFRLSFKGAVATVVQWTPLVHHPIEVAAVLAQLRRILAADQLPHRPNRVEPRARKRRPKNYQLLNRPRCEFHEIIHRNKYRKA